MPAVRSRLRVFLRFPQLYVGHVGQGFRRDFYLDRPGPPGLQMVKSLVHHVGHLGRVQNALGPLGNGADAVLLVVDLVQHSTVHAYHVALHLPRHHQYRGGCGVGGADAGSRVQQSRPRHHQRRADAAAGSGITVGHVGGCLLVPGGDEPDAGFIVQCVHGVVQLDSGQAEDYPYPLQIEGLHQGLTAGHLSHS